MLFDEVYRLQAFFFAYTHEELHFSHGFQFYIELNIFSFGRPFSLFNGIRGKLDFIYKDYPFVSPMRGYNTFGCFQANLIVLLSQLRFNFAILYFLFSYLGLLVPAP
jgi:hypothetical protein